MGEGGVNGKEQDGTTEMESLTMEPEQDAEQDGWMSVCIGFFRDDASLHGIRYVFIKSWILRRLIWLLILITATVVFIWLNTNNLQKYLSHPKKVDIDVSVKSKLTFPAVTICSYNKHRYTEVVKLGLFDTYYDIYEPKEASKPIKGSWYRYRSDICVYTQEELLSILSCMSNSTEEPCLKFERKLPDFSSINCESMCGNEIECSGFWYNRSSLNCILTRPRMKANTTSSTTVCRKESLEYYERIDIIDVPSFLCTFDTNDCGEHLIIGLDYGMKNEKFVVAKSNFMLKDYSEYEAGRGKYLRLFNTNRRHGFTAKFRTRQYMFINSCLEFFYRFLGEGETVAEIKLFNINRDYDLIKRINGSNSLEWQRFYVRLPDGPGHIKVEATRSSKFLPTGLIIDNFEIETCSKYKQNCLADPVGAFYEGDISVTQSGYKCIENKEWGVPAMCRNNDEDTRPWCHVLHPNSTDQWDYCDIPRCACADDEFLCSDSKVCIPKSMTCDGHKDCSNGEDERIPCESKSSLNCEFEDDFRCGYFTWPINELLWRKKNSREIFSDQGPKSDYMGDQDHYFMYVDTQPAIEGTKAILSSPPFQYLSDGFCLGFHIRAVSKFSNTAKLEIYLASEFMIFLNRKLITQIDLTETNFSEWTYYETYLPKMDTDKKFQIYWLYTMGLPVYSNIAIDNVELSNKCKKGNNEHVREILVRHPSFQCDFSDSDNCHISSFNPSAFTTWSWAPKGVEQYAFEKSAECASTQFPPRGYFHTPFYPKQVRFDETCILNIQGPPGSKVKLTFFKSKFGNFSMDYINIRTKSTDLYPGSQMLFLQPHTDDAEYVTEGDSISIYAMSNSGQLSLSAAYEFVSQQKERELILYNGLGLVKLLTILTTYMLQLNQVHCLILDYYSPNNPVKVILFGFEYNSELVYEGLPKQILKISIPAGTYAVTTMIYLNGPAGTVAVIRQFSIESGWCHMPYSIGSVTCDFTTWDICGYLDSSPIGQPYEWRRGSAEWLSTGKDGMILDYSAMQKTSNKAHLLSPTFFVKQTSCLKLWISSKNATTMQVSVFKSGNIFEQSNATYYDVNIFGTESQEVDVPIKENDRRIMFTVKKFDTNAVFIHSIRLESSTANCSADKEVTQLKESIIFGIQEAMESVSEKKNAANSQSIFGDVTGKTVRSNLTALKYVPGYNSNKRRDFRSYFSALDFYEQTVHQLEDLIFMCEFDGEECDLDKDFIKQRTNYGICYTFNSGKNNTLKESSVPGSRNGLRLVINTETNQNMKGLKSDDGIKIHIHDQDEIPSVKYIGKAAALSQHTYFEISRQDLHSMEKPYGTCGHKDLDLYPNETYSRSRCSQQCETKAWQKTCGCVDHYMPGENKYCNLKELRECEDVIDLHNMLSCECPIACHTKTYPSQSSASSLSYFGASKYLFENVKIRRIEEQVEKVLNRDYRMLPQLFEKFVVGLFRLYENLMMFKFFIEKNSMGLETSTFSLIQRTLIEFHETTLRDIITLKPGLTQLQDAAVGFRRASKMQHTSIEETISNLEYFMLHLSSNTISKIRLNWDDQKAVFAAKAQQILDFLQHQHHFGPLFWDKAKEALIPNGTLNQLGKLGFSNDCVQIKNFQIDNLFQTALVLLPHDSSSLVAFLEKQGLLNAVNKVLEYVHNMNKCTTDYLSALDDAVSSVMTALSTNHIGIANPDYNLEEELVSKLSHFGDVVFYDYYDPFHFAKISAVEVARNITDNMYEEFKKILERVNTMFQNNLMEGLKSEVFQHGPSSSMSTYMQVFQSLVTLYPFMQEEIRSNFTNTIRNMTIWKRPIPDINSNNLVGHSSEQEALVGVWSPTIGFPEFYGTKAEKVLMHNIEQFYNQLGYEIHKLGKMIMDRSDAVYGAYQELNETLREIRRDVLVDENYLLKNFLKLDVFFGELTHQIVTTSPAYTLADFFSDMGGYFGLLLGASVITLIEFLDLIAYNSYLHWQTRSRAKKKP